MRADLMFVVAAVLVSGACTAPPVESTAPPSGAASVDQTSLEVPLVGDVAAGRQAFLDLKCSACHAVSSEPALPAPVSDTPGPPLDGRLASRPASYLVAAIVAPSHAMSLDTPMAIRERLEGTLSPMSDFSHVMTVRQLVDLQAFLNSLK